MKSLLAISLWKTTRFDCRIEMVSPASETHLPPPKANAPVHREGSLHLTVVRLMPKHPQPLFRPFLFHNFPDPRFPHRRHLFLAFKDFGRP